MNEVQIDSIVGPTHYYGGLSYGNVASLAHKFKPSNPKKAALQGLEKMKLVHELGVVQLILPPQMRPDMSTLQALGFTGTEQQVIEKAYRSAPTLLIQCSSQSAMWTANAATVSPSYDTRDGKVHITPANLTTNLHRSLEAAFTSKLLKAVFHNARYFVHHAPLVSSHDFADEGAANHTRFDDGKKGLHFFVYGRENLSSNHRYPARQTRSSQEAIMRNHLLDPADVVFAQQNPEAIDLGVFHNDVIAVGHEQLFLFHEKAYVNMRQVLHALTSRMDLELVKISDKDLSIEDAVKSYLFNSQIVRDKNNKRVMLAPSEVERNRSAKAVAESLPGIDSIQYVALNQSMNNGGGPACLRLRLPLTTKEIASIHPGVRFTDETYQALKQVIAKYYPETFTPKYLQDASFRKTAKQSLHKIAQILCLPTIYDDE